MTASPRPIGDQAPALRILMVEDAEDDAWLTARALRQHGLEFSWQRVETREEMATALDAGGFDVVLADHNIPGFGAAAALDILAERGLDVPLIVVSGVVGDEAAAGAMRTGARDFVPKNALARLGPAVAREIGEAAERRASLETEHRMQELEAQLYRVIKHSPDLIVRFDRDLRITLANPTVERMAGVPASDLVGDSLSALGAPPELTDRLERYARQAISTGETMIVEHPVPTPALMRWFLSRFVPEPDGAGGFDHVLLTSTEITERKAAEHEMARRAMHDPLTDLPNRALFMDRLVHALARLEREPGQLAVLFLDLDRFKSINDSLGHGAGDEVLLHAARRIAGALRPPDTVARMGGDEFVVLLEDGHDDAEALAVAERISAAVVAPLAIGADSMELTVSIGIATTTQPIDADSLIRAADTAMYRAKERGRNRCEIFTDWLPDPGVGDGST